MSRLRRAWRHLTTAEHSLRRAFPQKALDAITAAVGVAEARHGGHIRFVIETALSVSSVHARLTPRERAIEVFSAQRVWDTENNDGVLIHLLLADRTVEIVADRGVAHGTVLPREWQAVCALMQSHFAEGRFEQGAIAGVYATADLLARHPAQPRGRGNELPDEPLLLG